MLDNFQGWGNRIGWWLTVCALAESIGSTKLFTGWHGAPKHMFGGRNYDYITVRKLVRFPRIMHWLEDVAASERWSGLSASSTDASASLEGINPALSGSGFREAFQAIDALSIPYHPKPYVNDYIPEPAWEVNHGVRCIELS